MSNTAEPGTGGVQSVDRALSILGLLARHGDLGVSELAIRLGVHKSTAFRLLATLERHDLVAQNGERGRYQLGVGVLRLAGATTLRLDLVQQSRPVCARLAADVGETVNITVLSGSDALYLDQVSGPSAIQLHNWAGQRIPLHATSNGKVLMSQVSAERLDELLVGPLKPFTERTITDAAVLRAELDMVRARGYATAVDELEHGLTAVAAPIVRADGMTIGSVSASGPTFRLSADRLPAVAERVMAAAAEISRRLGWHGVTTRTEMRQNA